MKGLTVTLSMSEVIALILAFFGFVGTTSMLVMNLQIRSSMQSQQVSFETKFSSVELKIENARLESSKEHSKVALEIANLRTKLAEDQGTLLAKVMTDMQNTFANRAAAETMHGANSQRLDGIDGRLEKLEEKINL